MKNNNFGVLDTVKADEVKKMEALLKKKYEEKTKDEPTRKNPA
ncbi:MAG: hypothetical protein ACI4J0_10860 [Huintestinicola sp.]